MFDDPSYLQIKSLNRIPFESIYDPQDQLIQIMKKFKLQIYHLEESNYICVVNKNENNEQYQVGWIKLHDEKVRNLFYPKCRASLQEVLDSKTPNIKNLLFHIGILTNPPK